MSASMSTFGHNNPLTPTVPLAKSRFIYPFIIVLGLSVFSVFLFDYMGNAVRFPVSRVEIGGKVVFLDRSQLMRIIKKHTQRGIFGLSIDEVRQEVVALPWVKDALVRRVMPDRLHIDVVERNPKMQWNDAGLIDETSEVFYPPQLLEGNANVDEWRARFAQLPHLKGVDQRSNGLQETFKNYQQVLQNNMPRLLGLYEDDRRSQTLLLEGNVIIRLGYEKTDARLARFSKLFPEYLTRDSSADLQFDMRYTNGFAVARTDKNANLITGYN